MITARAIVNGQGCVRYNVCVPLWHNITHVTVLFFIPAVTSNHSTL